METRHAHRNDRVSVSWTLALDRIGLGLIYAALKVTLTRAD